MPDGKALKFIDNGIRLCVGKLKGDIALTNDGKIQINVKEEQNIKLYSQGKIYFLTEEEGTIEATAGVKIQIINDTGSKICITDDTVKLEASVIENN